LTKSSFPPIIAFMSVNPGFRPYIFALLLNAALLASIPPGAYCADRNELITGAAAALEDEMYATAEQNIKQYLSLIADTNQPKTEYIIMLARALHGQKRYAEMLETLVQNQKESSSGSFAAPFAFWLALAFYDNGRWTAALEQISDFESRYPDSALIPDIIRLRAKTLLKLGRTSAAISAQERLTKEYARQPETADDQIALGQMLADSGRAEEACILLEKLLVFQPDTSTGQKCRSILGGIYADQKQWQKARTAYEPLINQGNVPDNYRLQAIESLAEIAAAQTNFSEAVNILENGQRLLSNPSQKDELSLRKGMLLLKMNKIDEGATLIHNFVRSQTTNALGAKIQLELAQTLLAGGLNERALIEFQNFLESFASRSDLTEAYQGKGTALFNLARYHEAVAAFGKAEESCLKPEEKALYRYRAADALFASGQFRPAAETYAQVAAMTSNSYLANMALFQTAECQWQIGDFPAAETLFWKVYDEDPADDLGPRALLRIADVLLQQNKLRAAEIIYTWLSRDYTDQWQTRAIYGRGVIAYRSGHFTDAIKYFEDTLRLAKLISPNGCRAASGGPLEEIMRTKAEADDELAAAAAYMSGWSCFMLNKTDEARQRFNGVVRSYPHSSKAPEALFWLGEHDYNSGHYDSAEKSFRRLAEDYPRSSLADEALFWAGRSALMQNEFRRGRDYFSTLIKNYPSSRRRTEGRYFQGVALCELGQFDAAILIFNEIIKQYPDHEPTAFKKADCQFVLGSDEPKRYEEAINSYQLILDRPECSVASRLQARYKIGRCLEKLGRPNEALAQYLQVVYAYLQNQEQTSSCNLWFARAAFGAAGIMEEKQQWRQAANIYQRVVDADIPASDDAQKRIDMLRSEHWLFFY